MTALLSEVFSANGPLASGVPGYRLRTQQLELAERIAAVLRRRTPQPEGMLVQLSVEIVDMDRPSYVKERL